jgi:hypothetical protein
MGPTGPETKNDSKLTDHDQDQILCTASQAVREQNMVMGAGTKNNCWWEPAASDQIRPDLDHQSHEREKCGHQSYRALNKEWLCWQRPGANYQTRTIMDPDGAQNHEWVYWRRPAANYQTRTDQDHQESGWWKPVANYCSAQSRHKKSIPSSCWRESSISKHVNGLGKNKNMVMGPNRAQKQ